MRAVLLGLTVAVLAGHPAIANQAASGNSTQARASQGSEEQTVGTATGEKVICRRDKEIGSRVKARRVCMTAAQWAAKLAEERNFVEQRQAQRTLSE